jgi:hypothetical protein
MGVSAQLSAYSLPVLAFIPRILRIVSHVSSLVRFSSYILPQVTSVYEVVNPLHTRIILSPESLRLAELVIMMGKSKIHSSTMEVNDLAENLGRHGRALNVPARSSRAPRAGPRRLTGFARFPSGFVSDMLRMAQGADLQGKVIFVSLDSRLG